MPYIIALASDPSRQETVSETELLPACARLSENGRHSLTITKRGEPVAPVAPAANSTFAHQVTDDAAKARIEDQHAALQSAGVAVDAGLQLYATGTRMADVGYDTQRARAAEHAAKMPVRDAAHALAQQVRDEKRTDVEVCAGDIAKGLHANGRITFDGLRFSEQAIRGLTSRLESPCLGYVLGVRDRVARDVVVGNSAKARGEDATAERLLTQARLDRAEIASVLAHECRQNPDVALKLRTRRGVGDVFAVLSPGYVTADAPEVLGEIVDGMPSDARATFAYDPESTSWELRASVWTPTPTDEQAVGEAFEGFVSFQSRDNGTSRFRGGGGVNLLRCLNASTYTANGVDVSRVHRGGIRSDIDRMLRGALSSVTALCKAWGVNRETAIEAPAGVRISEAIPGFWRYCLLDRKSELAGVLPGRSEEHVRGLTAAFFAERREPARLVRSDLAQGWTRYIQDQPTPVRREAESAIGGWLVRGTPLGCDLGRGK